MLSLSAEVKRICNQVMDINKDLFYCVEITYRPLNSSGYGIMYLVKKGDQRFYYVFKFDQNN